MGSYVPRPTLDLIFTPGRSGTRCAIYCSAGVTGGTAWVPTGHLALRVCADDLVGLTPAAAALKLLHHATRTLEHIVATQSATGGAPAPRMGPGGELENVPLPGLEPSTLT